MEEIVYMNSTSMILDVALNSIASLIFFKGTNNTLNIFIATKDSKNFNMKYQTKKYLKAYLLIHTKLIILDETPMMNKFWF